ncbi:MAG: ankyrin repeat domain-containing protein, partial [Phaeodactylibacter sp.]|nr:ankyrin repeat domain-containing protein [Phaeodactylibacter sp.]
AANGLRLVHEAVIRYWPDALNWFKNKKDFLKKEALYRQKANEWSSNGRPAEVEFITQDDVEDAAEILSPYLRDWGLRQGSADSLSEYDKLLRDYCLFVFRQSRTPDKAIKYMAKPAGTHVFRAAQYGMVGLLDAFRQIDPACLELPNNDTGNTPLHGAAWAHADTVEYLLRQGVAPAPRNNKGWTPIAAPILMGRMDIFRLLLKASKPEELDAPNGRNLLHICAEYGRVDMAHLLIYEGLDPGLPDDRRWKPFHYAANSGELEALKFFGKFSDITETTGQGFNALHLAAANGHAAVVHYLLNEPRFHQHYNARTEEGKTALHLAAENRHGEVVSLLLQACDPNEPVSKAQSGPGQNFRPLHLAINGRGYSSASDDPDPIFETAAALLDDGRTDPNLPDGRGRTPLQMAASFPKLQKLLLRHPKLEAAQPISEGGETPITVSAKLGDWESFRALTKRSGHVASELADEAGNTMLHLLSERNAPPDLIENTLANLAPEGLNTLNKEGLTPLFSAIKSKNWMLVRKLLEFKGIDPTLKGERKPTALMLALELKADKDTLDTLVRVAPSLFTETDYFGWTPLHRAVAFQQTDWINWLQNNAEEPKTLWEQTDLLGRRPMGLASPSIKKKLGSSRESGNWPRPRSWDSGLEWKPIKAEDKEKLKARIDPVDGQFTVDEHADAHTAVLSFYDPEKVRIIRVKSPAWNYSGLNVYYLEYEENLFRLNGTSPPIHELNSKAGISLNPENVLDYLRFFCFFVRGEGGPFLIAEGLAQEEIPSSLTEVEREALEKVLRPACYNGYDEERGEFLAIATIYYSNSVFFADFAIRNTGMIEMIEDLNAIENLSAGIARPLK